MDPTSRLRIATRIHFALLRQYGEDIAVSTLLGGEGDAREALWVCDASGDAELIALARQLRTAPKPMPVPAPQAAPSGATPQEMPWARDTSGFGVSRLLESAEASSARAGGWFKAARWLGNR